MKKFSRVLTVSLFVVLIYMLIVWFFVPANSYSDVFATEKQMRQVDTLQALATALPVWLIIAVITGALLVGFNLLFAKKIHNAVLWCVQVLFPSICAFVYNVFFVKQSLIGYPHESYDAHTIVLGPNDINALTYCNITMFDVLFALLIGGIVALLTHLIIIKTRKA